MRIEKADTPNEAQPVLPPIKSPVGTGPKNSHGRWANDPVFISPNKPRGSGGWPPADTRTQSGALINDHTATTQTDKKLGLVIDLDTCVGCHACVISCKGWNTENYGAPLSDQNAYGADPSGTFLNRVHSYRGAAAATSKRSASGADSSTSPNPACTAKTRPASPCARRVPATNGSKTASFWSTKRLHRLRLMRMGLPVRRPRNGSGREGDEKMHPLRGPHLQRKPARSGPRPVLRAHLPVRARATLGIWVIRQRRQPIGRRTRRYGPDAGARHQARKPILCRPAPKTRLPEFDVLAPFLAPRGREPKGFLGWLDKTLEKI